MIEKTSIQQFRRDTDIDFFKGIAVLSIIFIHTVFWSGSSYVPKFIQTISLLFDVPVFFFLSGATYTYKNSKSSVVKQCYKLIIYFFLLVLFFQIVFFDFNIKRLLGPITLSGSDIPIFPVVNGSYWFVPTYIISLFFAELFINHMRTLIPTFLLTTVCYYFLLFCNVKIDVYILGHQLQGIMFYIALILLGFYLYNKNVNIYIYIYIYRLFYNIFYFLDKHSFILASKL